MTNNCISVRCIQTAYHLYTFISTLTLPSAQQNQQFVSVDTSQCLSGVLIARGNDSNTITIFGPRYDTIAILYISSIVIRFCIVFLLTPWNINIPIHLSRCHSILSFSMLSKFITILRIHHFLYEIPKQHNRFFRQHQDYAIWTDPTNFHPNSYRELQSPAVLLCSGHWADSFHL